MILDLTDREAAMLTAMLTSASILSAHSTVDIYKGAYGPLLGKLLNQREQQERRSFKNVP
ncbi:MAG TPA: hypothetical protein DC024_10420 [Clostridiales bacterium]|jgi:hypothetical protein|nr:hypothetical protein [Clostridiales bacterium]